MLESTHLHSLLGRDHLYCCSTWQGKWDIKSRIVWAGAAEGQLSQPISCCASISKHPEQGAGINKLLLSVKCYPREYKQKFHPGNINPRWGIAKTKGMSLKQQLYEAKVEFLCKYFTRQYRFFIPQPQILALMPREQFLGRCSKHNGSLLSFHGNDSAYLAAASIVDPDIGRLSVGSSWFGYLQIPWYIASLTAQFIMKNTKSAHSSQFELGCL